MRVKELEKIRSLTATPTMMKMAAEDSPQKATQYYWDTDKYKYGLYMRCHIHDGILKVALFLTEAMRTGGRHPTYELFISKEHRQFVTYDRLHEKWLNSKLDNLSLPGYVYSSDSMWISRSDTTTINKYFCEVDESYNTLLKFQRQVRAEELKKQHKKETDPWDEDLTPTPSLPKEWKRWVSKVGIQQNYIYYSYCKKGADTGYCTFCDKNVPIKNPRHNKESKCICCRKPITMKSIGRAGIVSTKKYDMYLIQRFKEGFMVRWFEGYRRYPKGEYSSPECVYHEIRRAIYDNNGMAARAYYWGMYKNKFPRWIKNGVWCADSYYSYNGMIYGKTLPHLAKSELGRTGMIEVHSNTTPFDPQKYLAVFSAVPPLEKFVKANLPQMVRECLHNYKDFRDGIHNIDASSLTGILGINTQELKRLRQSDGGLSFLNWLRYENVTGKSIQDNVIMWLCAEKITPDDIRFISSKMNIVQIYNFIRRQMTVHKKFSRDVINTWADYLSMAKRLKMDTNDEIVFRVNKLYKRHDELVERCHDVDFAIRAGELLEKFPHVEEICEAIVAKYAYADDDYTIVVPTRIEDVLHEGRTLHHCIDGSDRYWERIERKESFLLFLRRTSNVEKAYYTLEIEPNGTIRQKRTMYDRQNKDIKKAKTFLKKWQSVVSERLTQEDKHLAEKSRILRNQSFTQLRDDQVIIHTGALAGQLLVDVLLADLMETVAV